MEYMVQAFLGHRNLVGVKLKRWKMGAILRGGTQLGRWRAAFDEPRAFWTIEFRRHNTNLLNPHFAF
jgi:hypothetical protein